MRNSGPRPGDCGFAAIISVRIRSNKRYVPDSMPMQRTAKPEEVSYAVLFLACGFSEIISGHVLMVDGGWTIKLGQQLNFR